jgi:hypothetical protein
MMRMGGTWPLALAGLWLILPLAVTSGFSPDPMRLKELPNEAVPPGLARVRSALSDSIELPVFGLPSSPWGRVFGLATATGAPPLDDIWVLELDLPLTATAQVSVPLPVQAESAGRFFVLSRGTGGTRSWHDRVCSQELATRECKTPHGPIAVNIEGDSWTVRATADRPCDEESCEYLVVLAGTHDRDPPSTVGVRVVISKDSASPAVCKIHQQAPGESAGGGETGSVLEFQDVGRRVGLTEEHWPSGPRTSPNCRWDHWDEESSVWDIGGFCMEDLLSGGIAVGDVNGDGISDLYIPRIESRDLLLLGGCNSSSAGVSPGGDARVEQRCKFRNVAAEAGIDAEDEPVSSSAAAFADIDADGDLDIFVSTIGAAAFRLYINDGKGRFSEEAAARGLANVKHFVVTDPLAKKIATSSLLDVTRSIAQAVFDLFSPFGTRYGIQESNAADTFNGLLWGTHDSQFSALPDEIQKAWAPLLRWSEPLGGEAQWTHPYPRLWDAEFLDDPFEAARVFRANVSREAREGVTRALGDLAQAQHSDNLNPMLVVRSVVMLIAEATLQQRLQVVCRDWTHPRLIPYTHEGLSELLQQTELEEAKLQKASMARAMGLSAIGKTVQFELENGDVGDDFLSWCKSLTRVMGLELLARATRQQLARLGASFSDKTAALTTGFSISVTDANLDGYPDFYTTDWHPAMDKGGLEESSVHLPSLIEFSNTSRIRGNIWGGPDRLPQEFYVVNADRSHASLASGKFPQSGSHARLLLNQGVMGTPGYFLDATREAGIRLRAPSTGVLFFGGKPLSRGFSELARAVIQSGILDARASFDVPLNTPRGFLVGVDQALDLLGSHADGLDEEAVQVLQLAINGLTNQLRATEAVASLQGQARAALEIAGALMRAFPHGVAVTEEARRKVASIGTIAGPLVSKMKRGVRSRLMREAQLNDSTLADPALSSDEEETMPPSETLHLEQADISGAFPHVGSFEFGASWVDLDMDGFPDAILSGDFGSSQIYWNNGDGTFTRGFFDLIEDTEDNSMGCTVADVNRDGLPDVLFSSVIVDERKILGLINNYRAGGFLLALRGNHLFINLGNRRFVDVTDDARVRYSGWAWGASFLDADNDGTLEAYVVNGIDDPETTDDDFATNTPNTLFVASDPWAHEIPVADSSGVARVTLRRHADHRVRAPSPLHFADMADAVGLADRRDGRGVAVLDYNMDGALDIVVVNHAQQPSLFENVQRPAQQRAGWFRVAARLPVVTVARTREFPGFDWAPLVHRTDGCTPVLPSQGGLVVCPTSLTRPDPSASAILQPAEDDPEWTLLEQSASSAAFLAQNEEAMHFGIGQGVDPGTPLFRLTVHWPSLNLTSSFFGLPSHSYLRITANMQQALDRTVQDLSARIEHPESEPDLYPRLWGMVSRPARREQQRFAFGRALDSCHSV